MRKYDLLATKLYLCRNFKPRLSVFASGKVFGDSDLFTFTVLLGGINVIAEDRVPKSHNNWTGLPVASSRALAVGSLDVSVI